MQQSISSGGGVQNQTDVKRETESQRIQRFQTYLAKFEQRHKVKPANVKGKLGDPGLLCE